jgi:hypothetical protein
MNGWELLNCKRRGDVKLESNIELVASTQTLTQKQLNGKISTYLSILTLNINGLNSPIKRYQTENWIKKETQIFVVYKKPIDTNIA